MNNPKVVTGVRGGLEYKVEVSREGESGPFTATAFCPTEGCEDRQTTTGHKTEQKAIGSAKKKMGGHLLRKALAKKQ